MSRCIFCGYCELACPFDAITLGNEFEISEYSRDDLIYTKDMLLAPSRSSACRSAIPTSTTRRSRPTSRAREGAQQTLMANFIVWVRLDRGRVRLPRLGRRGRDFRQPVLLGARADRQPRLARRALPARLGRVRRRGAGARLRGRGDGHVPVRDRLPRRPHRGAVGGRAVVAPGRRARRRGRAARRDRRRGRPRRRRRALRPGRRSRARSAAPRRSAGSSSPTTCSRSRSPRSCC